MTSVNLIKGNVSFKVLHQYMFDKELHYLTINEHTLIPKTFFLSIISSFIFLTLLLNLKQSMTVLALFSSPEPNVK